MSRVVERLVLELLRRRLGAGLLLLASLAAGLGGAARVEVDGSIEAWFLKDDQSLARYRAFRERFQVDEFVLVAGLGPGLLTPEGLACVERVRSAAEALPGCRRALWLTSVSVATAAPDGAIAVGPLVRDLPGSAEQARALLARAQAQESLRGLVSLAPPATAVLVELRREAQDMPGKLALVEGLRRALAAGRAPPGLELVLSGPPAFDEAFLRHTQRDLRALGPIGLLLLCAVMAAAFRRVSLALVPLLTVAAAVVWTLGLMGLVGWKVNPVSSNLVCVVLAVGVADAIHLVGEYRARLVPDAARELALARAAGAVFLPCAFTSLTTVAGMLSLATSELRPVREFGLLAALSVGLAFAATFLLAPLLLVRIGTAPAPARAHRLGRVARMGPRGRLLVVGTWAVALLVAGAGIARVEVGLNPVEYFRPQDPIRRDAERIDAALGGTASIELEVRAPLGMGLEDPARLALLRDLRARLEAERGVSYSQSILDPLQDLHRLWAEPGQGDQLPASPELVAQYYLLLESAPDLGRLLRPDHRTARLSLRTRMSLTDRPLDAVRRIEALARDPALAAAGLEVEVTGYVHLMASMYEYLLASQVESTLLALGLVSLAMFLVLRSLSLGLLAMVPNLVPLACGLGLMGWLGIRLDVGTVMIGSVALGLVVDDTVHLLARLRQRLGDPATPGVPAALERALNEVGAPVVVTSLALASGFGALACGSFLVNAYFGLVTASVILTALACDLTLTPVLVLLAPRGLLPGSHPVERERERRAPDPQPAPVRGPGPAACAGGERPR